MSIQEPNRLFAIYGEEDDGHLLEAPYLLDSEYDDTEVGANQVINANGIDSLIFETPHLIFNQELLPFGYSLTDYGKNHYIINRNKRLFPRSWASSQTGRPLVYNLRQYRTMRGFDSSEYGRPYLQGGVKYLSPRGYNSNAFGGLELVNTTANQTARPTGINSLVVPAPNVSPRILYPNGIYQPKIGRPDVRDPAIKPLGEVHTYYGTPTVWYHTRPITPNGILSYESGYLRIADPTQFIDPPSLLTSAIFGDTATRNLSFRVVVPAVFDGGFSDYTTLTNSNRYYEARGIDSLAIGSASIVNKTPSIFIEGIPSYGVGVPAIGHAIRFVYPTGFDRLLLGRPAVIKAPELLVKGHQDSIVPAPTVWYKNRAIDLTARGINSFKVGEQIVWFGLRPIKTIGWVSSKHSAPQLTHGVRTVETQGFRRDVLGVAWVSQGTRFVAPVGFYKQNPSNHMVGGTQTIEPVGYIATLWGTRIIPESQSVAPLGFAGVFGNATIDLGTKYVLPVGYISVGQQPADRWGDIVVYNKLQYIVQDFDGNNGLVPPKWSDWQSIENVNREAGITGFLSQKFGYSQIDNNAAPLLPLGIEPPPITIGMISHGVRIVSAEAIEALQISSWTVVYNDSRVLAPYGNVNTSYGEHNIVNTRRYFRDWGRIDSLEMGEPTISHRIRTIDIEPRHSISPPQINLPVIDLYTRYVSFRGYETAKYGLPSLSIHFNIIGPSWAHRDDFGYGAVRNNTPELLVGAFDSQEFGRASLRTQWRNVAAQGDTLTLFGSAMIADTKREISIRGWQDSVASQKHIVTKTGTPPYVAQNIWLQNESNPSADGFGIAPSSKPSSPGLNQNVLYHRGHNSQKFGEAALHSNNLYMDYGIYIKNFGTGTAIRNQNRYLDVVGIDNKIETGDKLMVTPFYIRPKGFNQPYDGYKFSSSDKFGRTVFTNQHRTIYPRGHSSSTAGYGVKLDLQTRYIEPPTIRGFAMGFPEIPFTPKTINLKDYGFNSEQYGRATIERPPYTGPQTVGARGFGSQSFGVNRVELLHRELLALGGDSLRMGTKLSNDKPFMWQGLRVGELVPMSISAGDTSVFGATVIGLRIREITLEGFVAFRSGYEPSRFKDRMKVIGSITDNTTHQNIDVDGFKSEEIGATSAKWGQQFIRPDGNSDQFRKGGYHA